MVLFKVRQSSGGDQPGEEEGEAKARVSLERGVCHPHRLPQPVPARRAQDPVHPLRHGQVVGGQDLTISAPSITLARCNKKQDANVMGRLAAIAFKSVKKVGYM